MASHPRTQISPEEYLERERQTEAKHEYRNGEIVAMGGASARHVLIATNIATELASQLRERPCMVYSADLRVRVTPNRLYTYPDVVVVCGKPLFAPDQKDTLTNPTVIVEVLSKSTSDYDRGEKFEQYRTLESFKEYVVVAQDKYHVEHSVRQVDNTWLLADTYRIEDRIELRSIDCHLELNRIYAKVELLELE